MPHRIQQRLRRILCVYLLAAWGTAWATISAAGPDLLSLPWAQASVGIGVAYLGGFAATLGRMVTASYDSRPFHTGREFTRDGAVSAVIGLSGYWGGMVQEIAPAWLALGLLLGGYGGTRTLNVWFDRVIRGGKQE